MCKIIQVKVNKGGIGKTFIASNLAHLLALLDYKVLILTTDTQNNVYSLFNKSNLDDFKGLKKSIINNKIFSIKLRENLDFIPIEDNIGETILSKIPDFLKKLKEIYDYIVIDSVPTMKVDNIFLDNSDTIIIPAYGDKTTINGVLNIIKEQKNKVSMIIFNKYTNTKINQEYYYQIKKICEGTGIFLSEPIKNCVYISELLEKGKSVWECKNKKIKGTQKVFQDIVKKII